MGIVKELADDRRNERLDESITRHVDNMNLDQLKDYVISDMTDYYYYKASEEKVEQFIKTNEYLPF